MIATNQKTGMENDMPNYKTHELLNELTLPYDQDNKTPDWEQIIDRVCALMPNISEAFVRYQVAKYVDRFY